MPPPKIYTKTGDKGETSLFGGKRVPKYDLRVEAYGTVDELNCAIGIAIAHLQSSKFKVKNELIHIQNDLFNIGSLLATIGLTINDVRFKLLEERVETFEKIIDEMTAKLPELKNFILPGGSIVGSQLHFARTICRRAERQIVKLARKEQIQPEIIQYFNRLSDLLFTMARFVNFIEKKEEQIWKKN